MRDAPVLPGAAIGVLGSGQLGRMFALAARRLGYRIHVFSPDRETPAGQVADVEVCASYDDLDAVAAFAHDVSVVTFEFENIPVATADAAAAHAHVRPSGRVLHTTQHRGREKTFLAVLGVPTAPFVLVDDEAALARAVAHVGCPCVLKTASFGYDGKGQVKIATQAEAAAAWQAIGRQPAVLEGFVDFARELSIVAVRGLHGAFAYFAVVENRHAEHILDLTLAPANVPEAVEREAVTLARTIVEALDVVGVLCVELFLTRDGRLLVNELAPRPHNSGHFTIDACVTSQFEQQVRAVCGLPLGSTRQHSPAAMANLLGDLWRDGEPDWPAALAEPDVLLHLYGKASARPGRKMGHITALGTSPAEAVARATAARTRLMRIGPSASLID